MATQPHPLLITPFSAGQIGSLWSLMPLGGMLLFPILGVMSDRTRSRFGRRRPYDLFTAPFWFLGLVRLPFTQTYAQAMMAMTLVAFAAAGHSVLIAYYNDVVPPELMGRFVAMPERLVHDVLGIERVRYGIDLHGSVLRAEWLARKQPLRRFHIDPDTVREGPGHSVPVSVVALPEQDLADAVAALMPWMAAFIPLGNLSAAPSASACAGSARRTTRRRPFSLLTGPSSVCPSACRPNSSASSSRVSAARAP